MRYWKKHPQSAAFAAMPWAINGTSTSSRREALADRTGKRTLNRRHSALGEVRFQFSILAGASRGTIFACISSGALLSVGRQEPL